MKWRGTVKLTNNQLTDPQDIGLVPVVNTPGLASDRAVNLNLTIPSRSLSLRCWRRARRLRPALEWLAQHEVESAEHGNVLDR